MTNRIIYSFNNYFTDEEKDKIIEKIGDDYENGYSNFGLHYGMNYAVDVSDIIGRTANIDIEIF